MGNLKRIANQIPILGIAELDRRNDELRTWILIFCAQSPVWDKEQNRLLHKTMNRLVRLIAGNLHEENRYLEKIECSCAGFFKNSSRMMISEILKFNQFLDHDRDAVLSLADLLAQWLAEHTARLNLHLQSHHRYQMLSFAPCYLLGENQKEEVL